MKNRGLRGIGFYLIVFVILIGTIIALYNSNNSDDIPYSEIIDYFKDEEVKVFILDGGTLVLQLKNDEYITYNVPDWNLFFRDVGDLITEQHEVGILEYYDVRPESALPWWVSFLPYVLMIVLFGVFWFFMFSRQDGGARGAMQFGKARVKQVNDQKQRKTFADVEGAVEEKAELQEIVDFLKNPRKYAELGARIPKGVLLVGPPGTGKTLLAKAVAGEAGVPFLSISGSDFVELYVGVGASRVRDLFDQAKKRQPAIVFIDEIDAVGRHRGAGLGGGHDEREQTLNQLLVEMDGFGANDGVIIIAATNRPDILDPALLRPGRFDRQVYVGVPDVKGREAILRLHAKNKKFEPEVNFEAIAKTSVGFTGADLENLLNEAALLAARRNLTRIGDPELQEALVKVIMGPEKKSRVVSEKDKRLTAYHEAGHAVVNKFLATQDPVHQISIIPRGQAGGYNINLPTEDKSYSSKSEMLEEVISLLGGRVAEEIVLGDVSTGASNDIERASDIIRKLVTKFGMSEALGPINYSSDNGEVFIGRDYGHTRSYSEKVAAEIDDEVQRYIKDAYARCAEILNAHIDKLHAVAEYLMKHELMDGAIFNRIMDGEEISVIEEDEARKEQEKAEIERKRREEAERLRLEEENRKQEDEKKVQEDTSSLPPWLTPHNGENKDS